LTRPAAALHDLHQVGLSYVKCLSRKSRLVHLTRVLVHSDRSGSITPLITVGRAVPGGLYSSSLCYPLPLTVRELLGPLPGEVEPAHSESDEVCDVKLSLKSSVRAK
jgi:hypothetical protein